MEDLMKCPATEHICGVKLGVVNFRTRNIIGFGSLLCNVNCQYGVEKVNCRSDKNIYSFCIIILIKN